MAVLFPFRVGHPPLLIPWSDISAYTYRFLFFFPMVKFHFKKEPAISFKLNLGLAQKLATASGGKLTITSSN